MSQSQSPRSADKSKARLGLILFAAYGLVYAGFVLLNTLSPVLMETRMFAGLNLAVVYGMGLIVLAIVMGLIYSQAASRMESREARNGAAK